MHKILLSAMRKGEFMGRFLFIELQKSINKSSENKTQSTFYDIPISTARQKEFTISYRWNTTKIGQQLDFLMVKDRQV